MILGKISLSGLSDQCRIEIHIVNDAVEIILCRRTYVAADTKGEFPFLIRQKEAGSIRVVKTHLRAVVHDSDDFISGLVPGDEHDGIRFLILDDYFLLRMSTDGENSDPQ